MIDAADLGFDGFVDLVRERMGAADALFPSRIHDVKDLVSDVENVPGTWPMEAVEELEAQGHIGVTAHGFGAPAARLSADGRLYLRMIGEAA